MFSKVYVKEARVLLLACIDITFILKKADDSIHSVVKKWTTTNLSEMKRDVEMENIYGMSNYYENSMSRFPFVNF